ncbi:MAG: AI-2E family transporter [Fidelibacterota bacterium]
MEEKNITLIFVVSITILLLLGFMFTIRDLLSPLLILIALTIFLFPFRGIGVINYFYKITIAAAIFWVVYRSQSILFPFVIAFIFAYFFNPVIEKMKILRLPRTISILIIILLLLGILLSFGIFIVPKVTSDISDLLQTVPKSPGLKIWFQKYVLDYLIRMNVPVDGIKERLIEEFPKRIQLFFQGFFKGFSGVVSTISALITQILNIVLIPFLTFYFLKDYDKISGSVKEFILKRFGSKASTFMGKSGEVLSGYLRGQLTVCLIVALLMYAGLIVAAVKYALVIAIIAGILNLIPIVGLIISLIIALIIGLFQYSPLITILKITVVFLIVQVMENSVISPKIVGSKVGLHPVVIILSILVFSKFFGFLGLLIAVPVTAIFKIYLIEVAAHYNSQIESAEELED